MESSRSGISATINPELLEVKAGSKCDTRIKEEAYRGGRGEKRGR